MGGISRRLSVIRRQWQLSLREVEERSRHFAEQQGSASYQVSAGWLSRLERGKHEVTVNKLLALANIYNVPIEHLIRFSRPPGHSSDAWKRTQAIDPTLAASGDRIEDKAEDFTPEKTALLTDKEDRIPSRYRRGIVGMRDLTLDPMIPPGSFVLIDTLKSKIRSAGNWTHEYQRPIYFLTTRDSYVCGWCELDRNSEWLTLVPHALSPATSRRWKYREEIECIGRVIAVAIAVNSPTDLGRRSSKATECQSSLELPAEHPPAP